MFRKFPSSNLGKLGGLPPRRLPNRLSVPKERSFMKIGIGTYSTTLLLLFQFAVASKISAAPGETSYPPQFPVPVWLRSHQRLCFGIDEKNLDEAVRDGTNVICGGTNAAGIGFAGGPVHSRKERRDRRHSHRPTRAGKDLANPADPCRQGPRPGRQSAGRSHPFLHDSVDPGRASRLARPSIRRAGKPITVEQLKDNAVLGCWNSPYGDWFIKSQVELVKRLDWDGYNMDGFGCWSHCFCPYCRAAYRKDRGRTFPLRSDVNDPEFRHYLKWRLDRYTHFVGKWTAALKAVKPDFVAAPWSTGPGPLVALDGRARRRRAPTPCTACSTLPFSSCCGISRPTREAICCPPSPAAIIAA